MGPRIALTPRITLLLTILLAAAVAGGCRAPSWLPPLVGGPQPGDREAAVPLAPVTSRAGSLVDLRGEPATAGLDTLLLARAVEEAAGLDQLHNMLVARHGEVVVERHFRGPPPQRPANLKSASKTILSAVAGLAIREGYLEGLDQPVGPFFRDYLPVTNGDGGAADDPRNRITVAHLLSMSSGLESTSFGSRYGRWVSSGDWVRHALTRDVIHEPGARLVYSTGDTHLMSAVLTRAAGRSTHALARELLADPLGIQLPSWPRDPQGIHFGGNDMLVSPRGLLRLGELYRNGGILDGREILPRWWVEESWRIRLRSPRSGDGYGLGWWARTSEGHPVRFAWGYGGQFLFVVPSLELTVVFTSDPWTRQRGHNQSLHRILDRYLIPAAERGRGTG